MPCNKETKMKNQNGLTEVKIWDIDEIQMCNEHGHIISYDDHLSDDCEWDEAMRKHLSEEAQAAFDADGGTDPEDTDYLDEYCYAKNMADKECFLADLFAGATKKSETLDNGNFNDSTYHEETLYHHDDYGHFIIGDGHAMSAYTTIDANNANSWGGAINVVMICDDMAKTFLRTGSYC